MVFSWHFLHSTNGYPVSFAFTPAVFPLALLDEGHTGVALFMTLSGYLFAKLLDGKTVDYAAFLRNRFLRLFPLLFLVVLTVGIQKALQGESPLSYAWSVAEGAIFPTLPNGGWSVTVECHYYLVLPLIMWIKSRSDKFLYFFVVSSIIFRTIIWIGDGDTQFLAYYTICGRIDQFIFGMIAYTFRSHIINRHFYVVSVLIIFCGIYCCFDFAGGYWNLSLSSASRLYWILLPTAEGLAYSVFIAWYDGSFNHSLKGVSWFVGRIGMYSYSIYLLHFFVVFRLAQFIHEKIMNISNFYIACFWSIVSFLMMLGAGHLSFRLIEMPFLKFRRSYIVNSITARP